MTYDHPGYCLERIDTDQSHDASKGKKTESSTLDAAERVFLHVDQNYGRSGSFLQAEIFVWGFSLGGAIATHLAYKFQDKVNAFPGPEPKDADVCFDPRQYLDLQ